MRVLIIGSGGREHTLTWKLAQSSRISQLYVAPGNGGTAAIAENVPIPADDVPGLAEFAQHKAIDLTVVGPELPLVAGIVDAFQARGLRIFGPSAAAAQLEGSKAFAKIFMVEEGIPTAAAAIFQDYAAAQAYLRQQRAPIVVKASGLAAGKGVLVCATMDGAEAALHQIMEQRAFGAAGDEVLIETCLVGKEVSLLAFCDGETVMPMLPARDYKRALDDDKGLNTGGMGGYAPSSDLPPALVHQITRRVLQPAVDGMRRRGTPYVGVLYAGLMLTELGPRVLEFNCRFGDPETQMLLPLLESDLCDVLIACVEGRLADVQVKWRSDFNVGVVLASGGYPGAYLTGKLISGLDAAEKVTGLIFHAGTERRGDQVLTSGGRVMAVNALGSTLEEARRHAYRAVEHIHFDGIHYRRDIAQAAESPTFSSPNGGAGQPSAYAAAGVDIDAGERAVEMMAASVRSTYTSAVLSDVGSFGGLFSLADLCRRGDIVLAATTDGVGTKTLIAEAMGRWTTIGHDIVNHCANDILVQGARPLLFLDYVAAAKLKPEQVADIAGGCAQACRELGCSLIGGETAEMPGVYHPGAFDLVGTMLGWVDRGAIVDGAAVRAGDVCLGIPSSGLHTNGYSLVRQVFADTSWEALLPELGKPLGEVLLTPHRAYLREIEALWGASVSIKAMAHITGGGFFANIPRALPTDLGVRLDQDAWDVPPIFRLIQARGHIDDREMYRVFNMGIGMVLVVASQDAQKAMHVLPGIIAIGETVVWDPNAPRVLL
jgi:phosphoribosylamine--glycine ligase/phosphoribosylformylglycinamidine cyclo-ligase